MGENTEFLADGVLSRSFRCNLSTKMLDRNLRCGTCSKQFFQEKHLRKHQEIHFKEHANQSPGVCSEFIPLCSPQDNQEKFHSNNKEYEYEYGSCLRIFSSICLLKELNHQDMNPVKCKFFDKGLTRRGNLANLNTPENIQTEERQYPCTCCEKVFTNPTILNKHKTQTHSTQKPYECLDCGKRFNGSWHLRRHQRVHTGEKPHQCEYCERRFSEKHDLTKHQRVHTGEKPYPCSQCGKYFSRTSNLKKHERTMHGEKGKVFINVTLDSDVCE